jgi:DNA polymerase-4
LAAAHKLIHEIREKTTLPCSVGLARTRLVAKVASDQAKPRGLVWVPAGSEERFLAPLGVRKIPGIGKVTEAGLRALGIETVGQLAARQHEKLVEEFGQWGTALYRKARGEDAYEFFVDAEPKSISHNHTFGEDTVDVELMATTLSHLAQKSAKRLRDAGLFARTITVTIRYASFRTITRGKTLPEATNLDTLILATSKQLFEEHRDRKQKIRLLGVHLSSLEAAAASGRQMEMLDPERRRKLERLSRAADKLRDRFGFSKVQFGGSLERK